MQRTPRGRGLGRGGPGDKRAGPYQPNHQKSPLHPKRALRRQGPYQPNPPSHRLRHPIRGIDISSPTLSKRLSYSNNLRHKPLSQSTRATCLQRRTHSRVVLQPSANLLELSLDPIRPPLIRGKLRVTRSEIASQSVLRTIPTKFIEQHNTAARTPIHKDAIPAITASGRKRPRRTRKTVRRSRHQRESLANVQIDKLHQMQDYNPNSILPNLRGYSFRIVNLSHRQDLRWSVGKLS